MNNYNKRVCMPPSRQRGFSLVELMIALVLGLLVVAAAGGMFLANRRVYASTESLNRIQEGVRTSFEIMSRDLREAGGMPCGSGAKIVNLLNARTTAWWTSFDDGMVGYDSVATGGAGAAHVAGTDAIDVFLTNEGNYTVRQQLTPGGDVQLNSATGLTTGNVVVACNTGMAFVFQVTSISGNDVRHAAGSGTPGNCIAQFVNDEPTGCTTPPATGYCLLVPTGTTPSASCVPSSDAPALLAPVSAVRWYIGDNGRGGRSLYRADIRNTTLTATPDVVNAMEIAEGVEDMQLLYRMVGESAFKNANDASIVWRNVNAIQVSIRFRAAEGALGAGDVRGTDGNVLTRSVTHTVAIRNREGVL